LQRYTAVQR
jgi:hypothetical protein